MLFRSNIMHVNVAAANMFEKITYTTHITEPTKHACTYVYVQTVKHSAYPFSEFGPQLSSTAAAI